MQGLDVKRLDHHGIVAGTFDALGFEETIDQILGVDPQETVTPGKAIKAMVLAGLGFSNRPLMLTPQFFANLPVEQLIGPGLTADELNRHKLGRTLDALYEKDCASVFAALAAQACVKENVDRSRQSIDTTSFSLEGAYESGSDTEAVRVCSGYSKDHRPDLKQIVAELVVSQDGGIPLLTRCHDGNTSDSRIFEARSRKLIESLRSSKGLEAWVGDSKLYAESNAASLAELPFITRIPRTVKLENKITESALSKPKSWQDIPMAKGYRYQRFELTHYGLEQRWLVVYSEAARERAEKTIKKNIEKERARMDKALFHFQAQRFACRTDGVKALAKLEKGLKFHRLTPATWTKEKKYGERGRPRGDASPTAVMFQGVAQAERDEGKIGTAIDTKSCFVVGTRIPIEAMADIEVIQTYKDQSKVETGFRFLKDPLFFTSSFFLKKPARIEGLLMVMTLALLVYSIAQRKLRSELDKQSETLPNQIGKPDPKPTLRWIFQSFEGITLIEVEGQSYLHGMNDMREKTIRLFNWPTIRAIYRLSEEEG